MHQINMHPGWKFIQICGKCKFLLIQSRDHIFAQISDQDLYSQIAANLQRSLLHCICELLNLFHSMCRKLSIYIPHQNSYILWNPSPISTRALLIHQLSSEASHCLSVIVNDYKARGPEVKVENKRVHFFTYLVTKAVNVLQLVLETCSNHFLCDLYC